MDDRQRMLSSHGIITCCDIREPRGKNLASQEKERDATERDQRGARGPPAVTVASTGVCGNASEAGARATNQPHRVLAHAAASWERRERRGT